ATRCADGILVERGELRVEIPLDRSVDFPSAAVAVGIRPESMHLLPGSASDGAPGTIVAIEPASHAIIIDVMVEGERLRVRGNREDRRILLYEPNAPVRIQVDPTAVRLFHPVTGERLM
ncbi:MAG TPA: TOBE domain-containing protein, partial [Thermomicrobiales bacterium]|nr:TOBE domain-containing protein [Thermomicrobiales bacterium]